MFCSADKTKKIVFIILDGLGVGELPDAGRYGDRGSNTLAHIAAALGGLHLPNLESLGLGNIVAVEGVPPAARPRAAFGMMAESSGGKDSTTGHWELAGLILDREFPLFPKGFPAPLMQSFLDVTGCGGYLGNTTASGTVIIQELGAEHVRTGFPIVYTSADSVFQIAAHEEVIPLDRLYEICELTRTRVCTGQYAVGRVIARPFLGTESKYTRTTNRRDFSLEPPAATVLDLLSKAGVRTTGVGKIDDLFAGRGLHTKIHTRTNAEGIARTVEAARTTSSGLVFTNLVDFDMLYGHRNDPEGFAGALEEFDRALPLVIDTLEERDLLILSADHGNDPVTPGTDHTREYVPLLCVSKSRAVGAHLGTRSTFADVGKTIAEYFGVENRLAGTSFLHQVC